MILINLKRREERRIKAASCEECLTQRCNSWRSYASYDAAVRCDLNSYSTIQQIQRSTIEYHHIEYYRYQAGNLKMLLSGGNMKRLIIIIIVIVVAVTGVVITTKSLKSQQLKLAVDEIPPKENRLKWYAAKSKEQGIAEVQIEAPMVEYLGTASRNLNEAISEYSLVIAKPVLS